jgi:hypothetical protein
MGIRAWFCYVYGIWAARDFPFFHLKPIAG